MGPGFAGPGGAGAIRISDLDFSYPRAAAPAAASAAAADPGAAPGPASEGSHEPLVQVSLAIAAGENVAIVGRTAAGKSTLVSLLVRLGDLPRGRVFLDGQDVAAMPLAELRRRVALVPQEPFLFSTTLLENLRYARPDAPDDDVRAAAGWVRISGEVASFPDGYDTRVGEGGLTLSRGQRQRIALARALLVEAEVLLLDDCFSAVDTHTEEEVLRELRRLRAGRTTVLITHRISTASAFDRIVVMEAGRIVQTGTHAELIAAPGPYARLARLQVLEQEVAAASDAPVTSP
jgi:ATP-binding cassette subfamily B protein